MSYPGAVPVEITRAGKDRLEILAAMFGRSFVDEPMMRWPLGVHGDLVERFTLHFAYFLEHVLGPGMVWEAGDAAGAAAWIPPEEKQAWGAAQITDPRTYALTEDGGERYDRFWSWIESNAPDGELWLLDSVGVEPELQGKGIGSALIEFGLELAREDQRGAFLETGTPRNVPYYERFGFRIVMHGDAPDGGPHIWFMRWDP